MNDITHLTGISSSFVETRRIRKYVLTAGDPAHIPVIFLHGNASASTIWEELMLELSDDYYCIAPDLRGYGQTDPEKLIDATRGVMDWVDDLEALADSLNLNRFHLAGHSLGGWVCWGAVAELAARIESVTLMAPGPPCGFGGIHGEDGKPNNPDYAGSGAGVVNQIFAENLRKGIRDGNDPVFSPRAVMNRFFWRDEFEPNREEELLSAMMQMHCGRKKYPGDYVESESWPFVAPGKYGPVNALSPAYNTGLVQRFLNSTDHPPVLWIYGDEDQIISDKSLSDPGYQGKLGYRAGWPGNKEYPPQPMISQVNYVLSQYQKNGATVSKKVISKSGHTPFLEQEKKVKGILNQFLRQFR